MTVKGFFIWCSRSKKIPIPVEDWEKRKFPSCFKIKPIILGEEKKTPKQTTLLNCPFNQWAGFNLVQFCLPVRGYEYPSVEMEMEMEAARQQRLTIEKFCLAPVVLRTPNNSPGTWGEDLSLSLCQHRPNRPSKLPSSSGKPACITPQFLPESPLSFPGSVSSGWTKC